MMKRVLQSVVGIVAVFAAGCAVPASDDAGDSAANTADEALGGDTYYTYFSGPGGFVSPNNYFSLDRSCGAYVLSASGGVLAQSPYGYKTSSSAECQTALQNLQRNFGGKQVLYEYVWYTVTFSGGKYHVSSDALGGCQNMSASACAAAWQTVWSL